MESTAAALAAVIKRAAADQGLTNSDLSAAAAMANTTLHRSLHGDRPFTYVELRSIAAALHTTVTALVSAAEGVAA